MNTNRCTVSRYRYDTVCPTAYIESRNLPIMIHVTMTTCHFVQSHV